MRRSEAVRLGALLALVAIAALTVAAASSRGARQATAAGRSGVDSDDFVRSITNPYLPYRPGTVYVYRGIKDGVGQRDVVRVTHRTKRILGVRCTAVTDVATHGRRLLEQTTDWYAQDRRGNVWYFGERTRAFSPGGHVDTSGSWLAGSHGARPGIVMTAHPRVGDTHRQEYWRGQAEDQYWLVDLNQTIDVPIGRFRHAALTLEWTRLEPNVIDKKFYVRGIGVVREEAAAGPHETASLVRFRRP